jgi:SPP1 family predicted phage head-tail adaptor
MGRLTAGEIKNSILIEKRSRTPNSMGGRAETWSTLCTVWGRYRQLSGKELLLQQQVNPLISVEITIRYRSDVTTDNRIYYRNKYHNILSVIDLENKRCWLQLMCEVKHSDQ